MMEGLSQTRVTVRDISLSVRQGGSGPPLLLLHGFPQTSMMWHRVAPALLADFTLVVPDLPGYGASDAPEDGPPRYAKREMARDMVALMEALGHSRFLIAGHDRGGRVAYRLSLDHPDRVIALACLDIVPTGALWADFTVQRALSFYHWLFLAQPAPLPERLIGGDPSYFLDTTMAGWTKPKDLSPFAAEAMAEYRAAFSRSQNIRGACDDYRAGATIDRTHDDEDLASEKTIAVPTLILWGAAFAAGDGRSPLDVWRATFAPNATGQPLDCGHFLCEEAPQAVTEALTAFFKDHR
ncbi:MAG: alpha/beta hydrolase [Pseudomonadota bacterium]